MAAISKAVTYSEYRKFEALLLYTIVIIVIRPKERLEWWANDSLGKFPPISGRSGRLLLLQMLPEIDGVGEIGVVVCVYGRAPFTVFGNDRVGLFLSTTEQRGQASTKRASVQCQAIHRLQIRDWGPAN